MKPPLLSICIPTYNRARYLPECLESIVTQFKDEEMFHKVEVVIADNASTDNTSEVVERYQKKYPNIHYFRNEKNLGFDRSFTKLIEKSSGIYCFSLGDDDALFDGAIATILKKIEKQDIPFFGLNCWGYDAELKNPVLPYPNLQIKEDLSYHKLSDYVKSIKKYTHLIGIFVGLSTQLFLREPWVKFQHKEDYFDTLAVHMYVNMNIFKNSPFMLIAEPVIKTRSSNIRWDVFEGLETVHGRIVETIKGAQWMKKQFQLPVSNTTLLLYFYTREYWFTFKEILKRALKKANMQKVIIYYRQLRSLIHQL